MQYQINPPNPKRRSKNNIFPEKHHLELQKSTSHFKSEWTNTINQLDFQEVIFNSELEPEPLLSKPKMQNKYRDKYRDKYPDKYLDKYREEEELQKQELQKQKSVFPVIPKPIYEKKIDIVVIPKKKENKAVQVYEKKSAIIYSKFFRKNNNEVIPKKIFICWSTLDLPTKMREVFLKNQELNPDFTFYLYDDKKCREFINTFFEEDVVFAFDTLIPGAYKADLWRLCILFVYGGIYIDIKYQCVNGFTFTNIIDKEYLTLDIPSIFWTNTMHGIYNGFMVSKPRNPFLWNGIRKIVTNVKEKIYGKTCLFPTGPGLLGDLYFENINETEFINKLDNEFECVFSTNLKNIIYNNTAILEIYPEYREEQKKETKQYYSYLWNKRRIYDLQIEETNKIYPVQKNINHDTAIIPLKIYQTWYTTDLPEILQDTVNSLKSQNPEFEFYLYDDNACRHFIQTHFDNNVVNAFDNLIPGAYKADLFRYCILFIQGGIYLDIKYYGINGFKFISFIDSEYLVRDIETSGYGFYNALMICKAGNLFLKKAIDKIVENVSIRFYGKSTLEPTGPLLLKEIIENDTSVMNTSVMNTSVNTSVMNTNTSTLHHRELFCSSDYNTVNYYIYDTVSNIAIMTYSNKYRKLQQELSNNKTKTQYSILWKEGKIYY